MKNTPIQRPLRDPDHLSKRGVPYWWAPEWTRATSSAATSFGKIKAILEKNTVNLYMVSKEGNRQLVLYWFQAHGRAVASEYWAKYYLVADSIRMNRSDGGLVRLMTPMYPGESPDTAQARVMKIGSQMIPLLNNYIPR